MTELRVFTAPADSAGVYAVNGHGGPTVTLTASDVDADPTGTATAAVATEATTRAAADTTLQTAITAEATTRAAADTALGTRVTTLEGNVGLFYNVESYGAVHDGTTNDRAAIQAAIDAASADGGGTVFLPAGTYRIANAASPAAGSSLLYMKSKVRLLGTGRGSILKWANSLHANVAYGISSDGFQWGMTLESFTIDGNKANNTTATTAIYLYSDPTFQPGPYQDTFGTGTVGFGNDSLVHDVTIIYPKGSGIITGSQHECSMISHCMVYGAGGDGFHLNVGNVATSCTAGFCGDGFYAGSGSRLTGCYAYGTGPIASGYSVSGPYATVSGCLAQETPGNAFRVTGLGNVVSGCTVDGVQASGVWLHDATGCKVDVTVNSHGSFPSGSYIPTYGLYVDGTSTGNRVDVLLQGTAPSIANVGGSSLAGNAYRVDSAISGADIEITDSAKGVILKSPNGTRYRMTVSNAGAAVFTSL